MRLVYVYVIGFHRRPCIRYASQSHRFYVKTLNAIDDTKMVVRQIVRQPLRVLRDERFNVSLILSWKKQNFQKLQECRRILPLQAGVHVRRLVLTVSQ